MRIPLSLILVFAGAATAASSCTTSVRRAALVPHQQPIGHSGARPESAEISLGTPNLVSSGEPRTAANENAGIVIPRWQGQGGLRVPVGEAMTVGFHAEYGLDEGSIALSDDQPDPEGDVMGAAMSIFYTAKLSPKLDVGIGGQLWVYSIPYVEYSTCVDCPGGSFTQVDHSREMIPVVSLGVIPTYKVAPAVSVFGGLTIRNHPTIEKSDIEIGIDIDEEVESGPANAIGSVGAEFLLSENIRLTGYLHRPIAAKPVVYGLTAGFMLTFITPVPPPAQSLQPQY